MSVTVSLKAHSQERFTILHTSDLHSHFTEHESPRKLGNFARLKTKIDEIRGQNPGRTLLLDSGDFSEGNIFFTLNSGESSQRLMQTLGFDAIVLGNHDWLVGPKDMYEAFQASGMTVPVVAANLNFDKLPKEIPLQRYLPPYVIKTVGAKRIAILGLTTFQLIYDHFFEPVRPTNPYLLTNRWIQKLKKQERCDAVIVLSHMGQGFDKILARFVPKMDAIIGGHSHVLYKHPFYQSGIPILHTGMWGQHLGEYTFEFTKEGVKLVEHKIHQIDSSIAEDPTVKYMVEGFQSQLERLFGGPVFNDRIVYTDVHLRSVKRDMFSNDFLGNLAVDAIREAGQTEVAFDSPLFASTQLFRGWVSTSDIFNLYPHIYSKADNESWTVLTYHVKGYILKTLFTVLAKAGVAVRMSNAEIVVDPNALYPIKSFRINGQEVQNGRTYTVSSTRGIFDVFRRLRALGIPFMPKEYKDTKKVMWREVARKLQQLSPITPDKVKWSGRVRTQQPDLAIQKEEVILRRVDNKVYVQLRVRNAGLSPAPFPKVRAYIDATPDDSVDEKWERINLGTKNIQSTLKPGEAVDFSSVVILNSVPSTGFVPITVYVDTFAGEVSTLNNRVTNDVEYLPAVVDDPASTKTRAH